MTTHGTGAGEVSGRVPRGRQRLAGRRKAGLEVRDGADVVVRGWWSVRVSSIYRTSSASASPTWLD